MVIMMKTGNFMNIIYKFILLFILPSFSINCSSVPIKSSIESRVLSYDNLEILKANLDIYTTQRDTIALYYFPFIGLKIYEHDSNGFTEITDRPPPGPLFPPSLSISFDQLEEYASLERSLCKSDNHLLYTGLNGVEKPKLHSDNDIDEQELEAAYESVMRGIVRLPPNTIVSKCFLFDITYLKPGDYALVFTYPDSIDFKHGMDAISFLEKRNIPFPIEHHPSDFSSLPKIRSETFFTID